MNKLHYVHTCMILHHVPVVHAVSQHHEKKKRILSDIILAKMINAEYNRDGKPYHKRGSATKNNK